MNPRLIPFFFYALIMVILWVAAIASGKAGFIAVPAVLTATWIVGLSLIWLQQHRRNRR